MVHGQFCNGNKILQMNELNAMKLFHEMFEETRVIMAVDAIIFQKCLDCLVLPLGNVPPNVAADNKIM